MTRSSSFVLAHAAVAAAFILTAPSCASIDRLVTVFRSTDAFIDSPDDPRVLYEAGAEALVRPVVAALPQALAEVEAATYGPFVVPIRIYVCGTLDCYRRFTGDDRSGGQTTPRHKIFISPKPENTAARVPFVVAHELTHLHLVQRCSTYRAAQMPIWFNEGFAALVSKGGGAEGVSDADAARVILAGRTFKHLSRSWLRDHRTGPENISGARPRGEPDDQVGRGVRTDHARSGGESGLDVDEDCCASAHLGHANCTRRQTAMRDL